MCEWHITLSSSLSWCLPPAPPCLSLTSRCWLADDSNSCWKPLSKRCSCMPVSSQTELTLYALNTLTHIHVQYSVMYMCIGVHVYWCTCTLYVHVLCCMMYVCYLDNCLTDIAENLLYILWRHLQFYLVHCKPMGGARELGMGGASLSKPRMRKLHGQL